MLFFVDTEHRRIVKDRMFVSFRRANNFKDILVWAKVYQPTYEQAERVLSNAMAGEAVKFCALIVEGGTFKHSNDSRSFMISPGA